MFVVDTIRQRARLIVAPILGISLVAYFAYHLVQGDRGLLAWLRLSQEIREARVAAAEVETERAPLAHRVSLLGDKVDRDLLDERTRATLNLVRPDEAIIFDPSR